MMTLISPLTIKNKIGSMTIAIPAFFFMTSSLGILTLITAATRSLTPKGKVGLFQGVRMVFMLLIPMIIGPGVTATITTLSKPIGLDEYSEKIYAYSPYMFTVAAIVMLINIPLLYVIFKHFRKKNSSLKTQTLPQFILRVRISQNSRLSIILIHKT